MAYVAEYINPLIQKGYMHFELLLIDEAQSLPSIRMPKKFAVGTGIGVFQEHAELAVNQALLEQELPSQEEVEVSVHLPEGVSL